MKRSNQFIGLRGENRKGADLFVLFWVMPILPQTSESEGFAIAQCDSVRLLRCTACFPLIERVRWHEAAARMIGASKRRCGFDGLNIAPVALVALILPPPFNLFVSGTDEMV